MIILYVNKQRKKSSFPESYIVDNERFQGSNDRQSYGLISKELHNTLIPTIIPTNQTYLFQSLDVQEGPNRGTKLKLRKISVGKNPLTK